jgi:hypothetical protein
MIANDDESRALFRYDERRRDGGWAASSSSSRPKEEESEERGGGRGGRRGRSAADGAVAAAVQRRWLNHNIFFLLSDFLWLALVCSLADCILLQSLDFSSLDRSG